ncbi:PREDICTED: nascent polypeptide-associated complex subunit alpha-like protein [Lupinus angustifolius]|uniref:nascent polypeptide-associated complex subunit alpha-like protein n=1 Tax=Lupinus angustifolius TaxID=3871 RepID=UPI00092F46B5|nr:PREDICTED: nascent polypeptide-associated complex subunit alpha-like protein [Lupinus angustifolius]
MGDYSFSYLASSSQFQGMPSMFGTTSNTSFSACNSQQYYQPTMPSQTNEDDEDDDDDDDSEDEDEEQSQLVRGGRQHQSQQQQQLKVQPPRMRKTPGCGTSSHRRH